MATMNNLCSYDGCTAPARSNVLHAICDTHYMARRRAIQDGKPWPTDMDGNYDPHTCPAHAIDKGAVEAKPKVETKVEAKPTPKDEGSVVISKPQADAIAEIFGGGKDERVDEIQERAARLESSISAHYK